MTKINHQPAKLSVSEQFAYKNFISEITPRVEKFIQDNSSKFLSEKEWVNEVIKAFPQDVSFKSDKPYLDGFAILNMVSKAKKDGTILFNDGKEISKKLHELLNREVQVHNVDKTTIEQLKESRANLEKEIVALKQTIEIKSKTVDTLNVAIVTKDNLINSYKAETSVLHEQLQEVQNTFFNRIRNWFK